ncbi:NAD(P)-dependent oxidoreductase [Catenovulum agarivorans]|uniref:NAD(P)-dependent oxidoreductase n=1 Tax=Catenovulum agarivorans TaxID=1172192 RepID=UPI00031E581F|nr:NAD(P)-binding oxidoreductase [Catenovulum agarivorans]
MTILVVGASGATGRLVVEKLLAEGQRVKIIVRSTEYLPNSQKQNSRLNITQASLLDLTDEELQTQVKGCHAVVCCLGHNLSFKGIYGQPRRLVTNAVKRLCQAIEHTRQENADVPTKFILMNSSGKQNQQAGEKIPMSQAIAISIIRYLIPPHADNEAAADYLQTNYPQQQNVIEWVAVRPDTLINEISDSAYDIYPAPIRNVIFNAGTTSRINVAHFMLSLINQAELWDRWKMQMPVIYNR